jgi:hypothetical protein
MVEGGPRDALRWLVVDAPDEPAPGPLTPVAGFD